MTSVALPGAVQVDVKRTRSSATESSGNSVAVSIDTRAYIDPLPRRWLFLRVTSFPPSDSTISHAAPPQDDSSPVHEDKLADCSPSTMATIVADSCGASPATARGLLPGLPAARKPSKLAMSERLHQSPTRRCGWTCMLVTALQLRGLRSPNDVEAAAYSATWTTLGVRRERSARRPQWTIAHCYFLTIQCTVGTHTAHERISIKPYVCPL